MNAGFGILEVKHEPESTLTPSEVKMKFTFIRGALKEIFEGGGEHYKEVITALSKDTEKTEDTEATHEALVAYAKVKMKGRAKKISSRIDEAVKKALEGMPEAKDVQFKVQNGDGVMDLLKLLFKDD